MMAHSEVFNMDCFEYAKTLPDNHFDLLLCDSPYVDIEENTGTIRTTGNKQSSLELGGKPSDEVFQELFRVSKHQIVWGANNFGYPFQGFVVWEKTNIPDDFTMSRCEIASLDKGLSRVSKMVRMSSASKGDEKRIHPTQKPIELYAWLLNKYAKEGWKVFDPFLGSGSSRIACDILGFDFVGCELNKEYYDLQEKRWKNHKAQLRMF
jgi:site-specific DNA-methyltransferase (adenine-specific)